MERSLARKTCVKRGFALLWTRFETSMNGCAMNAELIDVFVKKYASLSGIAHVAEGADAVAPIVVQVLRDVD